MIVIACLLILEGLSTGLWIARLVPMLDAYDVSVTALMIVRGVVGAMQLVGGVLIITRRPTAVFIARWALVLSAVLTFFEIGRRMTPSDLDPAWRWPLVVAYGIYALGAVSYLTAFGGSILPLPPPTIAPPPDEGRVSARPDADDLPLRPRPDEHDDTGAFD